MVFIAQNGCGKNSSNTGLHLLLVRNGGWLDYFALNAAKDGGTGLNIVGSCTVVYLDSPASTSALTYKSQYANSDNSGSVYTQYEGAMSTIVLMEVGA